MTLQEAFALALAAHQAGRLSEAEPVYRQIVERVPQLADAWNLLGVLCYQSGRQDEALRYLTQAIALNDSAASFHGNLGEVYRTLRQPLEAERCFRRAVELDANLVEAWSNWGLLLSEHGRTAESMPLFDQALTLRPGFVDALLNRSLALHSLGRHAEALPGLLSLFDQQPTHAKGLHVLAVVSDACLLNGELSTAEQGLARLCQLQPHDPHILRRWGDLQLRLGRYSAALEVYQQLLQHQSHDAELWLVASEALSSLGRRAEAIAALQRATELRPNSVEAWNNLGSLYKSGGEHGAALRCFEQGLQSAPNVAALHVNLGSLYLSQGRQDDAVAAYARAMELEPQWHVPHSGLLQAEQYRTGNTAARLAEMHREWDRRHAQPLRATWQPWNTSRDPRRKLRLGFVSRDWGRHPIGFLLRDVLRQLPREQFGIYCYSDRPQADDVTREIGQLATQFRDVKMLDDAQLAAHIRGDEIDILFDLAGHAAGNRLLTLARKPAPVQVSWLGYVGTTGLSAIDYLFTDAVMVPPGEDEHYTERIVRFTGAPAVFTPPDDLPEPGPLPAMQRGSITFASFNNPCKVTLQTLDVWSAILRQTPHSRLILKYFGFDDPLNRTRLHDLFAVRGVEPARIELQGYSPLREMLNLYRSVDLSLDPLPYTGGTTTFLALAMGVPVLTRTGNTVGTRQSASLLHAAGLHDWITRSPEEYVARAIAHTQQLEALAALRTRLRSQLLGSPFADSAALARQLTSVLRQIWEAYCRSGN